MASIPQISKEDIERWNYAAETCNKFQLNLSDLDDKMGSKLVKIRTEINTLETNQNKHLDQIREGISQIKGQLDNFVSQDEYQKFCIELKLSVNEVVDKYSEDIFDLKKDMAILKERSGKLKGGSNDDV